ncbi:juvenile hormone acid O-methyltransferase-like [Musca autumnalis]|uniref:juvenile hormone acid O-methyltransferase-like n=1 Tax=Musca autumnalis TaxID=221902 RepID=UPI003CF2103C
MRPPTITYAEFGSRSHGAVVSYSLIDIGSGPGDVVSDCIYPQMPRTYQRLVFSDLKSSMVEFARQHYHHLPNTEQAYINIFNLLRPEGGDILINAAPYVAGFDAFTKIAYNKKWMPYIKDSDLFTSALQNIKDPKGYMLDLLHSIGFYDCTVETKDCVHIFTLEEFKNSAKAVTPYMRRIPNHLHDDYLNDFVDTMSKLDPQCPRKPSVLK